MIFIIYNLYLQRCKNGNHNQWQSCLVMLDCLVLRPRPQYCTIAWYSEYFISIVAIINQHDSPFQSILSPACAAPSWSWRSSFLTKRKLPFLMIKEMMMLLMVVAHKTALACLIRTVIVMLSSDKRVDNNYYFMKGRGVRLTYIAKSVHSRLWSGLRCRIRWKCWPTC